jgi:ketosteroid isomerase-like protein
MDALERLQIIREIDDLAIYYWDDVDRNWGANAHHYFTEDATLATSQKVRKGRAAIKEFYDGRVARGERIARHIICNHKIVVHDRNTVSTVWVLMLYAADGVPVLPSKPAIMVADIHEEIVRGTDGKWLYKSRLTTPLFKDFDTQTTG